MVGLSGAGGGPYSDELVLAASAYEERTNNSASERRQKQTHKQNANKHGSKGRAKEDTKTKYKMSRKLENAVMENAENRRQIAELVRSTFFCCLIYSLFRIFTTPCLAGANYTGI